LVRLFALKKPDCGGEDQTQQKEIGWDYRIHRSLRWIGVDVQEREQGSAIANSQGYRPLFAPSIPLLGKLF
jgi:hypothetical protein